MKEVAATGFKKIKHGSTALDQKNCKKTTYNQTYGCCIKDQKVVWNRLWIWFAPINYLNITYVVLEVIKNIHAWPGRHLFDGGEQRVHGVVEFECRRQREYNMRTQDFLTMMTESLATHFLDFLYSY
ncbi:FORKED 1 [Artemisia annua]|uniref:FORKED 1 n=1 Tax=Artemisia annua TaxID=35608 RepID=A0A2U1LGX4_ARTAN|nr:FORKED 1 [Artemisia annua]